MGSLIIPGTGRSDGGGGVFIVVIALSYGNVIYQIHSIITGKSGDIKTAWHMDKPVYQKFITIKIYYLLLVMVGLVALILPGIYLAVRLSLSVPAALIEDRGIKDSFKRSATLVSHRWWRSFFVLVLPVLLTLWVPLIVVAIPSLFGIYLTLIEKSLLFLPIATFVLPWTYSLLLVYFNDMKLLYEKQAVASSELANNNFN